MYTKIYGLYIYLFPSRFCPKISKSKLDLSELHFCVLVVVVVMSSLSSEQDRERASLCCQQVRGIVRNLDDFQSTPV